MQRVCANSKKVIIIGSGIGGIATAIRLAIQGFDVSVYEKNPFPGGKLTAFEKNSYHFDAGPSLFTQPENIEELFALSNEPIENYFTYKPIEIACKYFFPNGKIVNAYTDPNKFAEELHNELNENTATVLKYLKNSEKVYNNIGTVFVNHSLHKWKTWFHRRVFKALTTTRLSYLFHSLNKFNAHNFSSPEAVQIFNRFATYNGSNPYKAPAMLSLIPHLEQNTGVYYPTGGMISITNALFNLAKAKGVKFYFNDPVQQIIYYDGKVTGVKVAENIIPADIVVSNGDIYFTYKNLLSDIGKSNKLLKQERSSSAVIFYWGIKKEFSQLQLHNIFFSSDYRKEFDNIFTSKIISSDPTVYINITSKLEMAQAPQGKENWFVMVNAPSNVGQNWEAIKKELREKVIDKLSKIFGEDIAQLIETEEIVDPVLIEAQTSSYMGSLYGTSSNSKFAAFLRHANFNNAIKGLYFCGGSVHPGGGIPLCLKSAKIVSELIQNEK